MERRDPEPAADERSSIEQFLDYQRATLLQKTEGLPTASTLDLPDLHAR